MSLIIAKDVEGEAWSVSGLGCPLGEGLLPMAIVVLIHAAGWRFSWAILGGIIGMLVLRVWACWR